MFIYLEVWIASVIHIPGWIKMTWLYVIPDGSNNINFKLLVHETCLQWHHPTDLISIVFIYKNVLFLIPPIRPINTKLLDKSYFSKVHSQSQVRPYMFSEQSEIQIQKIFN